MVFVVFVFKDLKAFFFFFAKIIKKMEENKKVYKVLGSVESYDWNDSNDKATAIKEMQKEVPILIKNFPMGPVKNWKWDYLAKNLPKNKNTTFSVYTSHQNRFL